MPIFHINSIDGKRTEVDDIGHMDGKFVQYVGDKKVLEYNYLNGKKQGTERGWYLNGNMWYIHQYNNGERVGKQIGWYSNGELWYIHHYH